MIFNKTKINMSSSKISRKGIIANDFRRNRTLYLMFLPVLIYYILFHYYPMYGAIIAFENYIPTKGITGSEWVGLKFFKEFFQSYYFGRILRNTLTISVSTLVFSFPAPIILALLINEIHSSKYARVTQTITYLPHFISLVVVCSLIKDFTSDTGVITTFLSYFGFQPKIMLNDPKLFVPIYIISDIWQQVGWSSIIYLSALAATDVSLYEAARIDGAGRFKQIIHVTIPSIMPTIIVMLILQVGKLLNVGYEKIILLYSPVTYETADVISSFVYRKGLLDLNWSYSAAVGLFNSAINFILLVFANQTSKKVNDTALW